MKHSAWIAVAIFVHSFIFSSAHAEEIAKLPVVYGGFIDTYYGYDFNNPLAHDRTYLTTAKRSNEFNLNLGYIDAKVNTDRVRGRIALQAGTSVQANYGAEPQISQHIQEAFAGYRVSEKLWVDAGTYFSHIGFETFISKDNWNYTRSLGTEFTPYYQTGVKATYLWSDRVTTQLHVINGWQVTTEKNSNKALGLQIAFTPNSVYSLTYNNFFGNEAGNQRRFFNELIAKITLNSLWQVAGVVDFGIQRRGDDSGESTWYGVTLLGRYQLNPTAGFGLRGETFVDHNQVIATTQSPHGFDARGASINADFQLHPALLWRNEVRAIWSKDPVFPGHDQAGQVDPSAVSSLSLAF